MVQFTDDGPKTTSISNIYGYNTNQPLNGVYNFSVGADSVGNSSTDGVILQSFTGVTAQGGTTPTGRAITNQTLDWNSETDTQVTYAFSFKYFAGPTSTQQETATGTVTFNKTNGTYTFDLTDPIGGQTTFSTSSPFKSFNYDTTGNNSPEIVVQQYSEAANFFGVLSAQGASPPSDANDLVTTNNDLGYDAGEVFKSAVTSYVNISTDTVGVDSDTVQAGELLNYDFYTVNPVSGATSPPQNPLATIDPNASRAYVDSLSITIDQITDGEDIAVLLKLYNQNFATNGLPEYTTKLLIANNAADYQTGAGSFKIVNITEANYDSTNYKIYGIQAVSSTENLTGTGYSLTGNNPVTLTATGNNYADTSDNDVFKIIKIDVTTKSTSNFDTDLNFVGQLVDGDADSAGFNFNVHLEADSSTLIGTSQSDYLTGTSAVNTINGGNGNDILLGLGGADQLTGNNGNDQFLFNSSSEGIDTITDFVVTDDTIVVSKSGFGDGLSTNMVNTSITAAQFQLGASDAASSAGTRFIYNSSTGALFYDSDGTGTNAGQQLATLNTGLSMTNTNIFVIA